MTELDLEIAIQELDKFDLVTVLETPRVEDLWRLKYGINMKHDNGNSRNKHAILAAERTNNSAELEMFELEFESLNRLDYLMYDHAKELHQKFALDLTT